MTNADSPGHTPKRPELSPGRQVLSWVWALAPAWTVGLATAPLMIVAIKRVRHWLHILLSMLYVVATVLLFSTADTAEGTGGDAVFGWALTANMVVATGHALVIRSAYFRARQTAPATPSGIARQQAALEGHRQVEQMRAAAREVAESDHARAVELRIGRIDLPQRAFPDGGLIDANNVPPDALAREVPALAPYTNALAAGQRLGFSSAEEMSVTLGLPPRELDLFTDRLIFLPRYEGPVADE